MSQDRTEDRPPPSRQMQRPPTAVEQAKQAAVAVREQLIQAVSDQRPMIEGFLNVYGVDWEFFVSALRVGLAQTMKSDRDFFDPHQGVTIGSFLDAVVRCAKDGLVPDGKQAAIVKFKREASYMPMVEGFCHILYATGFVRDINHNVVRKGDDIDFMEGDDGYVRHRRSLERVDGAKTIGAWCVINLATGGKIIEVCDDKDLADIAKVSRATKGPRIDWEDEMHRKGPFRRAIKRAPKNPRLAQLINHDDMNYDLSRASAGAGVVERTLVVPKEALFADKAAVKAQPKALSHEPAEVVEDLGAPMAMVEVQPAGDVVTAIRHVETLQELGELKARIGESADQYDDEELDWIDKAIDERASEMAGGVQQDDEDSSRLLAVIQSDKGPRAYDNPMEWRDDLLNKLSSLTGGAAKSFAKLNAQYVRNAMDQHPEEAGRVMKVFVDRNLIKEDAHGE